MIPSGLADIWPILGPLVGAILGFLGNYLIERRRERRKRIESLKVVECVELVNTKVVEKKSLGPIGGEIQIKVRELGPGSEFIDVDSIYFARYRLRNLSDIPIENFSVSSLNAPKKVSFTITEGADESSPEWSRQFHKLLQERKVSDERGWDAYPIPYLNPYSSTGQEVFLDLSSYLPLKEVRIAGGAMGVKFVFKKSDDIP